MAKRLYEGDDNAMKQVRYGQQQVAYAVPQATATPVYTQQVAPQQAYQAYQQGMMQQQLMQAIPQFQQQVVPAYGAPQYVQQQQPQATEQRRPQAPPAPPSKVLLVRNCSSLAVSQHDLRAVCERFGPVANILMLSAKNQALVEFETLQDAQRIMGSTPDSSAQIGMQKIYFHYSVHQELRNVQTPVINKVVIISFSSPHPPESYHLDTSSIQALCKSFGHIEKIIVLRKNGYQALVQFENSDVATACMRSLNGQSIQFGHLVLTLDVRYSKNQELTIHMESDMAKDFGKPVVALAPIVPSSIVPQQQQQQPVQQQQQPQETQQVQQVQQVQQAAEQQQVVQQTQDANAEAAAPAQ